MVPLSPSSLGRAAICAPSQVLPHAQIATHFTRRGTALHRFLFLVNTQGVDEALAWLISNAPDLIPAARTIDLHRLPASRPESYAAEVSLAWDPQTGKAVELGRGLEREEVHRLCPEGWLPMTLDILGDSQDAAEIWDYKTGYSEVDAAEDNWQLDGYSVAAASYLGRDATRQGIIRVPIEDGKDPWFDVAELDAFALQMAAERIREVIARVLEERRNLHAGGKPNLVVGPHCKRCPAFYFCPANMSLVRSVLVDVRSDAATKTEIDGYVTNLSGALTLDNFPETFAKLKAAEHLVEKLLEVVKNFAVQHGPVPLGSGWFYGRIEEEKEYVHPDTVRDVLIEMHGREVADAAVKVKLHASKDSIEQALRPLKEQIPGSTYASLNLAVLDKLRQRAGVAVKKVEMTKRFRHEADRKKKRLTK